MEIYEILSGEFGIRRDYAKNIIELVDAENTLPFIARYRKELTGGIDDQILREFCVRLEYLRKLFKRKDEIKSAIEEQGKWTEELEKALKLAATVTEAEDIYRPFKQKRKTRAGIAAERGLKPLADLILAQELTFGSLEDIALGFVNEERGVSSPKDAIDGARDIVSETLSDDAELRKLLRAYIFESGSIRSRAVSGADPVKALTYDMYKDRTERLRSIPSHRILAMNRGEKEECLKVSVEADDALAIAKIELKFVKNGSITTETVREAAADAYKRLIFPSIEREIRNSLTESAEERAIRMFELNLKPLLMQPPLKDKTVIGFDPAYRTGCKLAVVDKNGNCLETAVIYPTPPQSKKEQAEEKLGSLIEKYNADVISIGNGTASKESEIFVAGLIKTVKDPVSYTVVNEAGASVYSASKLGAEEFPDFDVSQRSAVSIARRIQDPLAELIKIDVKSIGVGQYQHDMPEKRLDSVLDGVVEDCVNKIGVDINTASVSLLKYVAGLNAAIAKSIVEARGKKPFESRGQLLEVKKLGSKIFNQCAGFLRVPGGKNILDNTGVHPESYGAVNKLLKMLGYSEEDIERGNFKDIEARLPELKIESAAKECGVGSLTLRDIISELKKPGRDARDSFPPPVLRSDLMSMDDLKAGMELDGTVRNVVDFGAFIDIGVHQDGLLHISEISDRFIRHPSEVLKVGDTVKVYVLDVDPVRKKIALTMRSQRAEGQKNRAKSREESSDKKPDLDAGLLELQRKFK